jgi:hypothetical protein
MDPRCAPERVLCADAPDQFAKLAINLWPPYPIPRFPPPEASKSGAMPTKDCFGLNDLDHVKQAWPQSDHPNQQRSVTASQSRIRGRLP